MNIQSAATQAANIKQPMDYRRDIDGLRAVSVISVVLYHYGIWPITGGFVGVDVFFVISGYLITSHLWKDIQAGTFSLLSFYDKRFRRILPALLTVLLASLVAGYLILMPGDYEALGSQGTYAAFGFSNFYFLWNTGYFDQEADLLPLLHTWSLAVEEQFYLFWPLVLAGFAMLVKRSRLAVLGLVLAIIAASLAASVWTVNREPSTAFYMLHTRAWELAAGALLVFVPRIGSRVLGEAANIIGLGLIVYTVLTITSDAPFPGLAALPPVLGAALVIWPKADTFSAKALGVEPMRQIGLASYSLYLWHWPVLVFFRHWNLGAMPSIAEAALLIAVSICLSFASLWWIERPFRRRRAARSTVLLSGLLLMSACAAPASALAHYDGMPGRISSGLHSIKDLRTMWLWDCGPKSRYKHFSKPYCNFGNSGWDDADKRIVLWGDSHAAHLAPIVRSTFGSQNVWAMLLHECPPIVGGSVHWHRPDKPVYQQQCIKIWDETTSFLRRHNGIDAVILSAAWSTKIDHLVNSAGDTRSNALGLERFEAALREVISRIAKKDRKIIIVADVPKWQTEDPIQCAVASDGSLLRRQCSAARANITKNTFESYQRSTYDVIKRVASERRDVVAILPGDVLCRDKKCENTINGEFIYRDVSHLRRNLSPETLSEIARIFGLDKALNDVGLKPKN